MVFVKALHLRSVGLVYRTKLNVLPKAFGMRWAKITRLFNLSFSGDRESLRLFELKKMCGGKNKKYRRVGNECRLTRCPFATWSVCRWSPAKMVYFFLVFSRLFVVVVSYLRLLVTIWVCLVADKSEGFVRLHEYK
jgi:hypothetical protein